MKGWIEVGTPEYAQAFETLLRHLESESEEVLRGFASQLGCTVAAVDWGAGSGRNTRILGEWFETVYAVEPSAALRQKLQETAPRAVILDDSIQTTVLPVQVDFGLISHVFYHIPDEEWGEVTAHCASFLKPQGVMLVVLKHPDSDCNRMLEAFGARRFDLFTLADRLSDHRDYTLEFQTTPGRITTGSLEDTITIARFMLSDRRRASFSRLPTDPEFEDYVRTHFWNSKENRGGWDCAEVVALIKRKRPVAPG